MPTSTNDAGGSDKFNYTYDTASQAQKREIAQQFIRACRDAGPCVEPPMIVYLDDYLGNRNNLILAENANGWLTQEMSEWYGAMYISYASAVRRLVYANQQAGILSSHWQTPFMNGTWPNRSPLWTLGTHSPDMGDGFFILVSRSRLLRR
jgi:hypothetical protein